MLQRFFGLFNKSEPKNLLPRTREEPTDDIVIIESNQEVEERLLNIVLDEAEEEHNNETQRAENQPNLFVDSSSTLLIAKPHRQLLWEEKNPKIFSKVVDQSGKIFDIRIVNKGKQLAFWDVKSNSQINVHRSPKDDQVIMHNRHILKMIK